MGAAALAARCYNARVAALPYDTSGGMYAEGESLSWLGVLVVFALAPTLLGLWFLRGCAHFWKLVAVASLAFAAFGLLAVLAPLALGGGGAPRPRCERRAQRVDPTGAAEPKAPIMAKGARSPGPEPDAEQPPQRETE